MLPGGKTGLVEVAEGLAHGIGRGKLDRLDIQLLDIRHHCRRPGTRNVEGQEEYCTETLPGLQTSTVEESLGSSRTSRQGCQMKRGVSKSRCGKSDGQVKLYEGPAVNCCNLSGYLWSPTAASRSYRLHRSKLCLCLPCLSQSRCPSLLPEASANRREYFRELMYQLRSTDQAN